MSLLKTFNFQSLWGNLSSDIQREVAQSIRRSIPEAFIWIIRCPNKFLTSVPNWFRFAKFVAPDGSKMIHLSLDSLLSLVEVPTGRVVFTAQYSEFLLDAEFSQDGQKIVTVSGRETSRIRIFDIFGRILLTLSTAENDQFVYAHFSDDALTMVSVQSHGSVKLWNVQSGALIRTIVDHGEYVVTASFDHDTSRIATLSTDGNCCLWDCKTGACLCIIAEVGSHVQLSPNGETIISVASDDFTGEGNIILEWDLSWIKQFSTFHIGPKPLEQTLLIILLYACSKPDCPVSLYLIAKHNPQIDYKELVSLWVNLDDQIRQMLRSTYQVVIGGEGRKNKRKSS